MSDVESIESRRKYNERLKRLHAPLVPWVEWFKAAIVLAVAIGFEYIVFTAGSNFVSEIKRLRETPETPNGPCRNEQCT